MPRRGKRRRRVQDSDDEDSEGEQQMEQMYSQRQERRRGRNSNRDARSAQNGHEEPPSASRNRDHVAVEVEEQMSDDDDEDYEEKLSQERGFNEEEMNTIVGNVMNYILLMNSKKMPVKMAEISRDYIKKKSRQSKLSNDMVMSIVAKRFKNLFGYKLLELPKANIYVIENKKSSKSQRTKRAPRIARSNTYVLMNANRNEEAIKHLNMMSPAELPAQGLLMVLYSLILCNKGIVPEFLLWQQLENVGIFRKRNHPTFGDVEKLVQTTFVKQMYLQRVKEKSQDILSQAETTYVYKMGRRGMAECSKVKAYRFMYEVINMQCNEAQLKYFERDEEQRIEDSQAV